MGFRDALSRRNDYLGDAVTSQLMSCSPRGVTKTDKPELSFRKFVGDVDIERMLDIQNRCYEADLIDLVLTLDELKEELKHPGNSNPSTDSVIAELDGRQVGHTMLGWQDDYKGRRMYFVYAFLEPRLHGTGLRDQLLWRCEERIREMSREHPAVLEKHFDTYCNIEDNDWKRVLEKAGFVPYLHMYEMLRNNLDDIPELPLPEGVEVRPVRPEHYRKIWDAMKEAFRDDRSFSEYRYGEEAFEKSKKTHYFMPDLWQIAWAGDEVVGGVHNYINVEENQALGRNWGHPERIFVARAWRKKGIARALIARSLRVLKTQGVEQASMDVDTENPSGALGIYESLGFRPKMHYARFWKPLD